MVQSSSDGSNTGSSVLAERVNVVDPSSLLGESGGNLVHEDGTSESTASDEATLLPRDGAVISDDGQAERLVRVRDSVLLLGQPEEEDVSSAARAKETPVSAPARSIPACSPAPQMTGEGVVN